MPSTRRFNETDATFVAGAAATGTTMAPVMVAVYEKPYADPETIGHLMEVMSRLLPAMRQRIAVDRFSTALPRWADLPGYESQDQTIILPAPGDGSLRAVFDWAEHWGRLEMPLDQPPWRSVYFEGVTVDGVPGRLVAVSQFHHAVIDGQGLAALAEHFYQWDADGSLPEMPPLPAPDRSTGWDHWKEGWIEEGSKLRALGSGLARRLRWAAADPAAARARARELLGALQRIKASQGDTTMSPLLRRTSDRYHFERVCTDFNALRAGARTVGGSGNDGLMAAVSLALHRYHLEHGLKVPEVRAGMPINLRTEADGNTGNQVAATVLPMPLLDDAAEAVKVLQANCRQARDDEDVLWIYNRLGAAVNRLPKPIAASLLRSSLDAVDVSISNVNGIPLRSWIGGVEVLEAVPFLIGGPPVAITLVSGPSFATIGIVTCPDAIPDPERLAQLLSEALDEVAALAA